MPLIFAFWTKKKDTKEEEDHIAVAEDSDRHVEEILYPASAQREIIELSDNKTPENTIDDGQDHIEEPKKPGEWMCPNAQKDSISKILRSRKKSSE